MLAKNIIPIHSRDYLELYTFFHSLKQPYGLTDILQFNRIYQPMYARLGPEERRRAEEIVDALVAGVESKSLAARIFGVV